jgi:hypothetical protein
MSSTPQLNPFELRQRNIRVVFVNPEIAAVVYSIFNPNEYELPNKAGIQACISRLESALIYANTTVSEINRYRVEQLYNEDIYTINREVPLSKDSFCELRSSTVRSNFEAFLISAKSLLDALCRYILNPKIQPYIDGFHKSGKIIGGKVINILERSVSDQTLPTRHELIDLIQVHKAKWIDDLVAMRDDVVHTGDLRNLIGFWMMIEAGRTHPYNGDDIHNPVLFSGQRNESLLTYCQGVIANLQTFTGAFQDLLFPLQERHKILNSLR